MTDDVWASIRQMYDRVADYQPPEPIKLTRQQWDWIRPHFGTPRPCANPACTVFDPGNLWATPIQIVATVEESTPYRKGWAGWHVAGDSPDQMINNKEGT